MRKCLLFTILMMFLITTISFSQFRIKGEPVKVTDDNAGYYFMSPKWSDDGSQIAVTGERYNGLWIIHMDGSGITKLTDDLSVGFGFEWSKDSEAIVSRFSKFDKWRRLNGVKIYDTKNGSSQLVSDLRASMSGLPHWAQNDQKVYIYSDKKLEVFDTNRKTSKLNKNSSSNEILFLKDDHIGKADINTRKIENLIPVKNARYLNLTIAPDQSRVAFEIMGGNMYVMNTDGTNLIDLGIGYRPQWAPDNKHLVYMVTEDDGHQYISSDLQIINIDTKEITRLKFKNNKLEMNPAWSPDGNKIAFDVLNEGNVYVIELTRE